MGINYLNHCIDGLVIDKSSGRPANLSLKQKQQLKTFLLEHNVKLNGGRLIGADIQEFIKEQFAVTYKQSNAYRLLLELDLRWITSRSKHPMQSIEAQETLKKTDV